MTIRPCTIDDIPWLGALVRGSYGDLVDLGRCEQYFRGTVGRPDHVYLRGEMSAGGSRAFLPWWAPLGSPPLSADVFFCAQPQRAAALELALVMKGMVEWAKGIGCRQHSFAAFNGANIWPLAKRAGAEDAVPAYRALF